MVDCMTDATTNKITYVGVTEAAARRGVHRNTIQRYCRERLIPGVIMPGKEYLIPLAEVNRIFIPRQGRPKTKPDRQRRGYEV